MCGWWLGSCTSTNTTNTQTVNSNVVYFDLISILALRLKLYFQTLSFD